MTLPANMFGAAYVPPTPAVRPVGYAFCSFWLRSMFMPCRQVDVPLTRYCTVTDDLRSWSPLIYHSKPSEMSVGGSGKNAPGVTRDEPKDDEMFCAVAIDRPIAKRNMTPHSNAACFNFRFIIILLGHPDV